MKGISASPGTDWMTKIALFLRNRSLVQPKRDTVLGPLSMTPRDKRSASRVFTKTRLYELKLTVTNPKDADIELLPPPKRRSSRN